MFVKFKILIRFSCIQRQNTNYFHSFKASIKKTSIFWSKLDVQRKRTSAAENEFFTICFKKERLTKWRFYLDLKSKNLKFYSFFSIRTFLNKNVRLKKCLRFKNMPRTYRVWAKAKHMRLKSSNYLGIFSLRKKTIIQFFLYYSNNKKQSNTRSRYKIIKTVKRVGLVQGVLHKIILFKHFKKC